MFAFNSIRIEKILNRIHIRRNCIANKKNICLFIETQNQFHNILILNDAVVSIICDCAIIEYAV